MIKRMLAGGIAGIAAQGINLISRIALPPIFIKYWGIDTYGHWLVLTSIVSYLSLSDIGAQLYIVNRLTIHNSLNNSEEFKKELKSGIIFFTLFPIIAFILLMVIILIINSIGIFKLLNNREDLIVILVLGLSYIISLPFGMLLGVYRSKGYIAKSIMFSNVLVVLQMLMTIIFLKMNFEMIGIALCLVIPNFIIFYFAIKDIHKTYPSLDIYKFERPDYIFLKKSLKPSLHFFNIQVSQAINIQGIILVIGFILGSAQVVTFSVVRTVVNSSRQILSLIINTAWQELTSLYTVGKFNELRWLFQFILQLTMLMTLSICALLILYGKPIFEYWLGTKFVYDVNLMNLFIIYIVEFILWTTSGNLLMSINCHKEYSKLLLITSILSIIASLLGAILFGLSGVIIGMIFIDLLLPIWLVPKFVIKNIHIFKINFFFINNIIPLASILFMIIFVELIPYILILNLLWILFFIKQNKYLHAKN